MKKNSYCMCIVSALQKDAPQMARILIEKKAAACAQVSAPITSFYWWQNKIEESKEVLIFIKSAQSKINEIKKILDHIHPYEVYELMVFPAADGNQKYFQWIRDAINTRSSF